MVDDEPVGRAEALGPEPGTVAIAGHDEQICPGGGGHDLALDAATALDARTGPGQPAAAAASRSAADAAASSASRGPGSRSG